MNPTQRELCERKSVRVFLDLPVPDSYKEKLFEAAMEAPTAGCQQLYTILDITDQPLKEQLAELCDHQPFIASAPVVLVFLADCARWPQVYEAAGCAPRKAGAGDLMLAMADACIAAQNVVVSAHSMGLGSCYIGDILENCEEVRQALNLPAGVVPAAMLVIGWPTKQQLERRKPARFQTNYIVSKNTYPAFTPEQHRQALEDRAQRGQNEQFCFEQWVQAFEKRKYDSDFSREMSRSAGEYLKDFLDET